MPRRWKNSDDNTYYFDRSVEGKLDKLRTELIKDYAKKKIVKKNYNNNHNRKVSYTPRSK